MADNLRYHGRNGKIGIIRFERYISSTKMEFDVTKADLSKINSLTKYPSIYTFHKLDPKNGNLLEECKKFAGRVLASEKVDGTNSRIILLSDNTFLIIIREELLYTRGDLIDNPALGIVNTLTSAAEKLFREGENSITVFYGEVYGGKVTQASKQYTGSKQVGYRLFDIVQMNDYENLLTMSAAEISKWRDNGGQPYVNESRLIAMAESHGLSLAPKIFECSADELPTQVEETLTFLQEKLEKSHGCLDDAGEGMPEGLVLRAVDRSTIAKLRFQDYKRTLKRRK